jgi:hypothetical protein
MKIKNYQYIKIQELTDFFEKNFTTKEKSIMIYLNSEKFVEMIEKRKLKHDRILKINSIIE